MIDSFSVLDMLELCAGDDEKKQELFQRLACVYAVSIAAIEINTHLKEIAPLDGRFRTTETGKQIDTFKKFLIKFLDDLNTERTLLINEITQS